MSATPEGRERWEKLRARRLEADPAARAGYERARRAHALAEQVRALRQLRGLSQRQLAERMGTTQSAIARLEGGGVAPSLATLERLASALDAELVVSLREHQEPTPLVASG
jgi:ribosome-binding protein aMBF1 (putative translation factor)